MSFRRQGLTYRSTPRTPWSTYKGEACHQQKSLSPNEKSSSSSMSSAADVDVHTAWDNYDLMELPIERRRSDDRCSLLTQWTESSASLKSCRSHNAASRLVTTQSTSTNADSDDGPHWRRPDTNRRELKHRDRHRRDTMPTSKRIVDSNLLSRLNRNQSRKCGFARSAVQQNDERKRRVASRSPSMGRDGGRRRSSRSVSAARRRHATRPTCNVRRASMTANTNEVSDDDYITTSSEDDDRPSTSSFVPDRASLLSSTTTSSSAEFAAPSFRRTHERILRNPAHLPLTHLKLKCPSSPRKRASSGSSRSLTTSNDMNNAHDDDNYDNDDNVDNDVESSRSSEEVAVVVRRPAESVPCECREDDIRTVRSLFEFRSSDELRIANDFIDGVWNLCSRRSLYNERCICPKPISLSSATPKSLFQLHYSFSEKDLRLYESYDDGEIVANDDQKSSLEDITDNDERSLETKQNVQEAIEDSNSSRRLNVAEIMVHCDSVHKLEDRKCSRSEFRPVEMISKLNDVTATTSNEDELTICIRKSPKTLNEVPNDTQARNADVSGESNCVPLPTLVQSACSKKLKHAVVSDVLSVPHNEPFVIGEKSSGMTTLLADWLANRTGVSKLTEAVDSNSRFSNELIQVFEALLIRSGVGEAASVANDIKMFHPLTEGDTDFTTNERLDASKLLQADIDSFPRTLVKPTDDEFRSPSMKSGKRACVNKNRDRNNKERECDILWQLTHRLSVKPDLTTDLASIELKNPMSCDTKEANFELFSPNQLSNNNNECSTPMNIVQTNDCNDDSGSTGETRMRISRKSRGRGKVRELIKLFESVSASKLDSSASPMDVKRATISAAVSVGELLRRASEQEVTSCTQHACLLTDVTAEQPTVASAKSTEAFCSPGVAQALLPHEDECLSKPEELVVVHKSTAGWPTSRVCRRHFQRRRTTSAADREASRIDFERLSTTHNSTSDTKTTKTDNGSENTPRVDEVIRETSEAVSLSNKADMKLINECQEASVIHSQNSPLRTGQQEACDFEVASTSNPSLPVVDTCCLTDVELESSMLSASRPENTCQSPSSSPLSAQMRLTNRVFSDTAIAVTPLAGGSGDVGGHQQECGPTASNNTEKSAAHFHGEGLPSSKHTVRIKPDSVLRQNLGSPCQLQSASTSLSKTKTETTSKSTETSSREIATNNVCRQFDVRSWFIAGGPRLDEVPLWPLTSAKDVVSKVKRSKSRERRPAKATAETEASCPLAYPVVRMPGVTVQLVTKDDANDKHSGEGNKTDGVEYSANSHSKGNPKPGTQSRKKKSSRSHDIQDTKHKSCHTVTRLPKDDEKEFSEKSTLRRSSNKTVRHAATTKTIGFEQDFDKTASPGLDLKVLSTQEHNDRPTRDCNSVTTPNRRTTSDVTCSNPGDSHDPTKTPTSQRFSPGKQSETTSLNRTPPITAKCAPDSGETTRSPGSVTVVYSRRQKKSVRTSAVNAATPSEVISERTQPQTTDSYQRLAQQFLLTSLLEYRLDVRRK